MPEKWPSKMMIKAINNTYTNKISDSLSGNLTNGSQLSYWG